MKCKEVGGWMWQCNCNLHQGWWQSRFKRIQKFDFKKPSPLFWRVFDRISNSLNHSEGSACQSPISTGNPTCICVQIISAANDNDKRLKLFQYLSINVFNYCGPKLLHHFHNADAWLRWIEPPDDSIDPVVLPSVGLRSNSIFSEKRRNEERMTGKGGRFGENLDRKHREPCWGGWWRGLSWQPSTTSNIFLFGACIKGRVHFAFPLDSEWRN